MKINFLLEFNIYWLLVESFMWIFINVHTGLDFKDDALTAHPFKFDSVIQGLHIYIRIWDFQAQLSNTSPAFNIAGLLPQVSDSFSKVLHCFLNDH